jgi:GPH family glycoside/pentoside/hexuronide:cation symporter
MGAMDDSGQAPATGANRTDAVMRQLTSLRTKLFYGLGSIAFGVKDNGFQTILLLFYNQVMHVPAALVGLAILIALVFDAFLDPIVGQFSDNLRTRWGRRHPLMYFSALPVAVSYLLLWNPPHWSTGALFLYLIVVAVIVRTFITFYEIPSSALAPELTEDYDQRTSFLSFRVFFAWYGGLTMLELAYVVFLRPDAHHAVGQLNETGYSRYGLTAAIVMFCAILISAAGTHRFIPYFRAPQTERKSILQYGKEMIASLSNRPFLILMLAAIPFNLATGLIFALSIYINTYFWQLTNVQIFMLTLSTFIAVLFAFLIAVPFSRRWGKRNSAIVMFLAGLAFVVAPLALRLYAVFPQNGARALLPTLFAFQTVGGALTIGSSIIMLSMLADVVEHNELRTGRRSEGLFFAGGSFLAKVVSGSGVAASGLLLSLIHFPDHAIPGHIDPHILRNLALVYLPALVILYGTAVTVISRYPISREDHEENVRRLAAEVAEAGAPGP